MFGVAAIVTVGIERIGIDAITVGERKAIVKGRVIVNHHAILLYLNNNTYCNPRKN